MPTTKTKIKDVKVTQNKNSLIILGPRITEKSALGSEKGQYTFNVASFANKSEIAKAIKVLYKVIPIKISITIRKEKKSFRGGRQRIKSGGKKAVVYLKKGDKITFV